MEPGKLVENPLKPEWGPGKVLRLEGALAEVVFRDDPDRSPRRFKAGFLTTAASQTDPVLDLIEVGAAGSALKRKVRTSGRGGKKHEAGDERAKVGWLGSEGAELWSAFQLVFGPHVRAFGSAALGHGGASDGNEGVQWNATVFRDSGERRVGVNLEGIKYDGWPIGRLISRELRDATLPGLVQELPDLTDVVIRFERDAWQASNRIAIEEQEIAPSPMPLSELTDAAWQQMLREARGCLRPAAGSFMRVKRTVKPLSGEAKQAEVSPHLMVYVRADSVTSWLQFMQAAKARLEPIYHWALDESGAA